MNAKSSLRAAVVPPLAVVGSAFLLSVAIRAIDEALGRDGVRLPLLDSVAEAAFFTVLLTTLALLVTARRDAVSPPSRLVDLGAARIATIAALACLILAFQFATVVRLRPFPFTHWAMYTRPTPSLAYMEFIVELESGWVGHYPFTMLQPTSPRQLMSRFAPAIDLALDADADPARRAIARADLEADLVALAALHDRRRPGDRVIAIEAARRRVTTAEYTGVESIARELVVRVELDADGSVGR